MPRFIKTTAGRYVNLDHVVEVQQVQGEDGFRLLGTKDECIGNVAAEDWDFHNATFMPAAPGTIAVILQCSSEERPRIEDVLNYETIIIAWRLRHYGECPEPIFVEVSYGESTCFLLQQPDGRLTRPDEGVYETLNEAKAAYLREQQKAWDAEHASSTEDTK